VVGGQLSTELARISMHLARPIDTSTPDGRRVALIFDAALNGGGLVVCSWCGQWQRVKRDLPAGSVSHTICPACSTRVLSDSISTVSESLAQTQCVCSRSAPTPRAAVTVESLCL